MITTTYSVSVRGKQTGGEWVRLPVTRSRAQVNALKSRYREVRAIPINQVESTAADMREDFSDAMKALARLVRRDDALGRRAADAMAALLGPQEEVELSAVEPVPGIDPFPATQERHTMRGVGP